MHITIVNEEINVKGVNLKQSKSVPLEQLIAYANHKPANKYIGSKLSDVLFMEF